MLFSSYPYLISVPINSSVLSCSLDIVKRTTIMSYKVIVIIFVFLIPAALLLYSNIKILIIVSSNCFSIIFFTFIMILIEKEQKILNYHIHVIKLRKECMMK